MHNLVGMLLAQQGSLDVAVKAFEAALELDPENSDAAGNLEQLRKHMAEQSGAAAKDAKPGATGGAATTADAAVESDPATPAKEAAPSAAEGTAPVTPDATPPAVAPEQSESAPAPAPAPAEQPQ